MREDRKKLIDELIKNFDNHRHFETDKFLYWIRDDYYYNNSKVTRDEFTNIKDYAIKNGTLPFISIKNKIRKDREEKKKKKDSLNVSTFEYHHDLVNTQTYSRQRIVRYSKQYKNVEVYDYDIEVRSPAKAKAKRVLVFSKKTKLFSLNDKNYVLINGNRWLSLKNWSGFQHRDFSGMITNKVSVMLLNMMLGGKNWISEFKEPMPYFISNKNSRKANSLDEAINLECGMTPPKIIKRALNNDVNEIINLYSIIDANKIPYLTNFIKRNHKNLSNLLEKLSYPKSELLLYYFFLSKDNRCEQNTFHDYLRMLRQEGKKINLNISSYTTIKRNHDKISRYILEKNRDKRRLRVSKIYPNIKSTPGVEVEMIKKADRLDEESKILHHCVHGYKSSINNGECAIYSLVHKEERYTLQLNAVPKPIKDVERLSEEENEGYNFKIAQLKGKYNCSPPKSLKIELDKICKKYELTLPSMISFIDKVNKASGIKAPVVVKKEIKQIGEAILESLVKKTFKVNNRVDAFVNDDLPF